MIDIIAREHDDFSFEFKLGYRARSKSRKNRFRINFWIFIPGSLDINRRTYSREDFYKDLRNNIRLITPVFLLRDIAKADSLPFAHLKHSFDLLASSTSKISKADYEYQIKMFSAIFKSAIRDQFRYVFLLQNSSDRELLFEEIICDIQTVLDRYRSLSGIIKTPAISRECYNYYEFGDEFMSTLVENHLFAILEEHCSQNSDFSLRFNEKIVALIKSEQNHRIEQGYPAVSDNTPENNTNLVFRRDLLKKFIESDLFLDARIKKDGVLTEQIYLSLAAGVSMVFATAVAFSFQQRFGSFTMPLFVALVVSYMLKDRIKELMRHYFAHKKGSKYFDNKTTVSIKNNQIGWSKEGFDFVPESKIPPEIIKIRNRSALLEADNRYAREKIILYRKMIEIDREKLDENSKYSVEGVNEILRVSVNSFINKMDDPRVFLYHLQNGNQISRMESIKVYYLNFIVQLKSGSVDESKRYRLTINRDGIKNIEEIK